jgi:beta-fructofuranosidase
VSKLPEYVRLSSNLTLTDFGGDNPFFINRGGISGFDNVFFTDKFSTTNLIKSDGTFSLIGVIDRSIFEVFLDGGERSATTTYFPNEPLTHLTINATSIQDGMTISVSVHAIKSAWADLADENGSVAGNVTSS